MEFPRLQETEIHRDMTTVFGGYNHRISCAEGQFYDMHNMTSTYFPIMSPRKKRGIVKTLSDPQGLLDKDSLYWIDGKVLYKDGEALKVDGVTFSDASPKNMTKMGANIIVMPDKIWINTETGKGGKMDARFDLHEGQIITFSMCEADGKAIVWHTNEYYKENPPKDGDYLMSVGSSGKPSLKVYSATTGIWLNVTSTYVQITASGISEGFEKGDGIKISSEKRIGSGGVEVTTTKDEETGDVTTTVKNLFDVSLEHILINAEDDGTYTTNTYIVDKTDTSIVIPGILGMPIYPEEGDNEGSLEGEGNTLPVLFRFERSVPDMEYITECGNRLWGCSKDGHEIYCCKLGDFKNWNCFQGISTDSWAATVGSDGVFTGAVSYLGYPMFFKENSFIKVAISTTGAHQTKETMCRGVQRGSGGSLAIVNETLFYKSANCVCAYNGSLPVSVSDDLGEDRYSDAVAGAAGDKYYISMKGSDGKYDMFVFDSKNGIWCREDDTRVLCFANHKDGLYFIDAESKCLAAIDSEDLVAIREDEVEWSVETGAIGYSSPDNKYVARINMRIGLDFGTSVDFFVQYDSCGEWEHKFNIGGAGTRTVSVPFIPRRCDHFRYRISGKGGCKIYGISKTVEQGGEM